MDKKRYLFVAEKSSTKKLLEKSFKKVKNKVNYDVDFVVSNNCVIDIANPAYRTSVESLREYPILKLNGREIGEHYRIITDGFRKKCEEKIVKKLSENGYDAIVNACDPDEEGLLNFAYVVESLRIYGCQQKQFKFMSLSNEELSKLFVEFERKGE